MKWRAEAELKQVAVDWLELELSLVRKPIQVEQRTELVLIQAVGLNQVRMLVLIGDHQLYCEIMVHPCHCGTEALLEILVVESIQEQEQILVSEYFLAAALTVDHHVLHCHVALVEIRDEMEFVVLEDASGIEIVRSSDPFDYLVDLLQLCEY